MSNTVKGPADIIMETYLAKGNPNVLRESIESALEEYASKLHLLQQEYDNLSGCYNDLLKVHSGLINESSKLIARNEIIKDEYDKLKVEKEKLRQAADENMEEYTKRLIELTTLKSEYDKLKGEIEEVIDLNESVASDYNKVRNLHQQLLKEHASLKEKADKMEAMLRDVRKNSRLSVRLEIEIDDCLSSYNSNTPKSGVYIGNPKGYCHGCGFPVDECNCESNTNNQNESNG